jgi:hypothetical protein
MRRARSLTVVALLAAIVVGCSAPGPLPSPTPQPPRDVTVTVVDCTNQSPVPNATLQAGTATPLRAQTGPESSTPPRARSR